MVDAVSNLMVDELQVLTPVPSPAAVFSRPGSVCGGAAAEGPEGVDQPAVSQHPDRRAPGSPVRTVEGSQRDRRCE